MNHYIQQLYTALVAADEVTYDTISFLEPYFNDSVVTPLDPLDPQYQDSYEPEPEPVADYETIQEVREIVSDLFYKLWFVEHTLTDEQVLSLQTTIRDGKKQTGRAESEPLVFYKKDRNTLENRQDLQGSNFEQICQDIFDNEIIDMGDKFEIKVLPEIDYVNLEFPPKFGFEYWKLQQHVMRYTKVNQTTIDVIIADEAILYRKVKETNFESPELIDAGGILSIPVETTGSLA